MKDVWVRSQDGQKLGNYKFIYAANKTVSAETTLDVDVLGEYESSDRALQVLEEIHSTIENGFKQDEICNGLRVASEAVYCMPEK